MPKHKTEKTMQIDRSTIAEQMRIAMKSRKTACFVVMGGLDVGSVIRIPERPAIIGRDAACDLTLRDDGISRNHVQIERKGPDCLIIKDLDSTNGTFVGGQKISKVVLENGDKVLLGRRTVLKFVLQDELEENYQQQMYESSTKDGLTGIFNRKYFDQKVVTDLSFAARHKVPFTLLLLDIDHFKKVNDTYGHRTGDRVLVEVCNAFMKALRTEDILARYGGEEFVVIAQGTDFAGGLALGERLRNAVGALAVPAEDSPETILRVTVSVGTATVPPGMKVEPQTIVSAADKNLYAAKEGGRNRTISSELK